MKTVRRIIPSGLFLLCLAFFSPIIRGRDAHDLLELMHEMYIIIIAAFLRNHSNALIRLCQQLFGMGMRLLITSWVKLMPKQRVYSF